MFALPTRTAIPSIMSPLNVVVHSDGLLVDAPVFWWENCTFDPLLFVVVDKLCRGSKVMEHMADLMGLW